MDQGGARDPSLGLDERLRLLYPMVNEKELPRTWSSSDKYNYITLTNGNLRVQYKGHGKTHKDAVPVQWLKKGFEWTWLRFALAQPYVVLALTGMLLYFSFDALTKMGGNFLPAFREPTALIATTAAPGTRGASPFS